MEFQMQEEDLDVNDPGDDVMDLNDAEDDPTWNPNNESLLSEEGDGQAWVEAGPVQSLEDRYHKIKSEIENDEPHQQPPRDQQATVPIANRRLFKIRLNDLLFSDHYRQLRDCVLQNRVARMSDIDSMLQGVPVDESEAAKNDEKFRKQHRDTQLLRELCITEKFLQNHEKKDQENLNGEAIPAPEKVEQTNNEQNISPDGEQLLEDW